MKRCERRRCKLWRGVRSEGVRGKGRCIIRSVREGLKIRRERCEREILTSESRGPGTPLVPRSCSSLACLKLKAPKGD